MTSVPVSGKPFIVGIALAAGQSTRFGGDKRLAAVDDQQTVLQRTVATLQPLVNRLVVTLKPEDRGREGMLLGKFVDLPDVSLCYAAHASEGLSGSIKDALQVLAEQQENTIDGVLIALADMPFVHAETIDFIIKRWAPDKIVRPCLRPATKSSDNGGVAVQHPIIPGNPVLFGSGWVAQLQQCRGDSGAKFILQANPDAVVDVVVDDSGILRDIDRPSDLNI